jgi:two-component system, sensor histidine kinase
MMQNEPKRDGRAMELGKILVIEDNNDSRDILSKLLRLSGYDVFSAADGEAGLSAAADYRPDLIITDIHLPKVNGIEFIKKIRENEPLAHTAILVVTAFGSNVVREAINAGADASAEKPFDFDKFLKTVQELIAKHKPTAES